MRHAFLRARAHGNAATKYDKRLPSRAFWTVGRAVYFAVESTRSTPITPAR
jgi:hypothetical protein